MCEHVLVAKERKILLANLNFGRLTIMRIFHTQKKALHTVSGLCLFSGYQQV